MNQGLDAGLGDEMLRRAMEDRVNGIDIAVDAMVKVLSDLTKAVEELNARIEALEEET